MLRIQGHQGGRSMTDPTSKIISGAIGLIWLVTGRNRTSYFRFGLFRLELLGWREFSPRRQKRGQDPFTQKTSPVQKRVLTPFRVRLVLPLCGIGIGGRGVKVFVGAEGNFSIAVSFFFYDVAPSFAPDHTCFPVNHFPLASGGWDVYFFLPCRQD